MPTRVSWLAASVVCLCGLLQAATPPAHDPLRILIVSDEVNPHGLSPGDLTQPGEISAAILAPGSGLAVDPLPDSVLEIPTNQIDLATAALSVPLANPAAYDVLIYFAHRIPNNGNDDQARQDAFTAAVEAYLQAGGGVVSFHHGSYLTGGKAGIQELIGASATGAVPWNTGEGQNVINVAPTHCIPRHELSYPSTTTYADPGRGIPADDYPLFNNTPDERYVNFDLNPTAQEVEILFASDYDQNGTTHLLGFTHRAAGWEGVVVAYQPGEYQPNALDPAGNNFQVLANAIVYAADAVNIDEVRLLLDRGPLPGEVTLLFTGCLRDFGIYRATGAASIDVPANLIAETPDRRITDLPPAAPLTFYFVARP